MSVTIESAAKEFNCHVRELINKAIYKSNDPKLKQLKARLNLVINSAPLSLIEISEQYIWDHRKIINGVYDKEHNNYNWEGIKNVRIDDAIDDQSRIIFDLINNIFDDSTEDEKIEAYSDVIMILRVVAQYRNITKSN